MAQMLYQILEYNEKFVQNKQYEEFRAGKFPYKKMVILSCMDTRLTELLPSAMNLRNGDAKFVKNAGALVSHPFGSIMRSILVAVYELQAEEIYVIAHHGCGMLNMNPSNMIEHMKERGIGDETIRTLKHAGIDLHNWLHGFDDVVTSVRESVDAIKNHPLVLKNIAVHGLVIDPETGKLDLVVDGYKELEKAVQA